jgi:membrane fusion protein, multidrug efflux system
VTDARAAPVVARRWRPLLLWGVPLLAVAGGALWLAAAARYSSTDNAYLKAEMSELAPDVSGTLREVRVLENAPVRKGEVLLVVQGEGLRLAAVEADAKVQAALTEIRTLQAGHREKLTELEVARRDAAFATRELERQRGLAAKGLVAVARLDDAERAADEATGHARVLEREVQRLAAALGPALGSDAARHPAVLAARAAAAQAALDYSHVEVKAPRDGIASHVPQVGDRVTAGRPALAIVDTAGVWVEANFKETDLENVRAGQPAEVEIDTYPHRAWQGTVQSIAQATGAEFAVLPAQNASGNWVKVVQRVPVRIRLRLSADDPPLRAGMSANVTIDTGDRPLRERLFGAR